MKRNDFRPWIGAGALVLALLLVGVPAVLGPGRRSGNTPLGQGPFMQRAGLRGRVGQSPERAEYIPTPRGAAPTRPVPPASVDARDLRMAVSRTRNAVEARDWPRAESEATRLGLVWRNVRPGLSRQPGRLRELATFETGYRALRLDIQDRNYGRSRTGLTTLGDLSDRF